MEHSPYTAEHDAFMQQVSCVYVYVCVCVSAGHVKDQLSVSFVRVCST